MLQNRVMELRT